MHTARLCIFGLCVKSIFVEAMSIYKLSSEDWRRIWIDYDDSPLKQEAIEILRQHIEEYQASLLSYDATWARHYRRKDAYD